MRKTFFNEATGTYYEPFEKVYDHTWCRTYEIDENGDEINISTSIMNRSELEKMKMISDNVPTMQDELKMEMICNEIIESGRYRIAEEYMDDEIREELHSEISPCADYVFFAEYMARHFKEYGKVFEI